MGVWIGSYWSIMLKRAFEDAFRLKTKMQGRKLAQLQAIAFYTGNVRSGKKEEIS